jgi:RNA polymerase sigma factor (sigma-70 family)
MRLDPGSRPADDGAAACAAPDQEQGVIAPTDEQLMLRYRDGDAEAFASLYQRHRGPLYRYLRHGCGHPATAEELFQDVWTGLIKARTGYRVEASFTTWLYRLAHNRLVDHYRRTQIRWEDNASLPEHPDPAPGQEQLVHDADCVARLQTALGNLPAAQREAFVLREETDLSLEQIGALAGVGRETLKSRLRYALKYLRATLEDCL